MAAKLVVSKDSGELLFDTSKICYGLVKSGSMAYLGTWPRKYLRSAQLDPNNGASWTNSFRAGDDMYGFSISGAKSPIVFIVGKGTLQGTARSGELITFYYGGGSASTRYYCFDLMADNIAGSPYLKTWTENGVITFNSLQPPLNVVASIQAPPPPSGSDRYGRKASTYSGGRNEKIRYQTASVDTQIQSLVDIPISTGIEYAAFLPWSRSAGAIETDSLPGGGPIVEYGLAEGAYGRIGGISFMFSPGGRSPNHYLSGNQYSPPVSFSNIPTDRYPTALVIKTAGLPFPYN